MKNTELIFVTDFGEHRMSKYIEKIYRAAPLKKNGRVDMRFKTSRVWAEVEKKLLKNPRMSVA